MAKTDDQEQSIPEEERSYGYRYRKHAHGSGHIGALIIIFVGIIFLLNNLNLLPWTIWDQLWKFWPVIIILIGLQIFLGHSWLSRIVITLFTLFLLSGILAYILFSNGLLPVPPGM